MYKSSTYTYSTGMHVAILLADKIEHCRTISKCVASLVRPCHLASQGLSNVGIATCVPKIHSTKQRMWRACYVNTFIGSVWRQLF